MTLSPDQIIMFELVGHRDQCDRVLHMDRHGAAHVSRQC